MHCTMVWDRATSPLHGGPPLKWQFAASDAGI